MKTLEEFKSGIPDVIESMKNTPQNPKYHAEGDVWTHTQMVMEALQLLDEYHSMSEERRNVLDFACLLHDIGKTVCTKTVKGEITSKGHSLKSETMARQLLWKAGFNGTMESMLFRESVCALVRNHEKPLHFLEDVMNDESKTVNELIRMSAYTPAPHYGINMLHALSYADMNGRICTVKVDGFDSIDLMKDYAETSDCFTHPASLGGGYSRYAFLEGSKNTYPGQILYNDTWGEVIVMSGLPASGKTTFIKNCLPQLPVVSLDEIRRKNGISPTGNQGKVIAIAFNMVKAHLRKHEPFVWDATCINRDMRKKIIGTCMDYGAFVHVVYMEAEENERLKRNAEREYTVPDDAMERMKEKLVPPTYDEAHQVTWLTSDADIIKDGKAFKLS